MIGQTIGSYVLESKLGEGGMGEVYLGRHQSLDTLAAVKVMSPAFSHDPRLHERFSREAKTQAQLRHPNIAQVLDHVERDGRWFLVIEYMPKGTLEDVLEKRREPLPAAEALAWSRQALLGLDYAHQHGIVHRDIKPANLLINERGEAAVTDFGIALEAGARRLTQTGVSIGTPEYMSPEQIRGAADLDHRTDIYSMGVVVYELLAGRVPFHSESIFEVQRAQVADPPPPLRTVAPHVPEALEALVMRALAKDPDERYSSCGDFAAALEAFESAGAAGVEAGGAVPPPPPRAHRRTVFESSPGEPLAQPPAPPKTQVAPFQPVSPAGPAPRKATMALAPERSTESALSPPVAKKKPWLGWAVAAVLALAVLGVGAVFMGGDPEKDSAGGSPELAEKVEEIEKLELEAASAAGAAEAASAKALAEAAATGEKARAAATSASGGSCSLAQNHAQGASAHAEGCRTAATEAESEAERAEDAARRAAAFATELEETREVRRSSPSRRAFEALAGLAYADDGVDDATLRRRGLDSSNRADDAAKKARAAGDTAQAAAKDAEKASGEARSAATACSNARRPGGAGGAAHQPSNGTRMQPSGGVQAPPQTPPSFAALPEKPVVAVLAVGDPLMAATLEATMEERLRRGGFDVRDELNSLELASLLDKRGADVSMSEILPILVREGFHVAVMVKVEEGVRKRVHARGQSLHAVIARLRLNAHLLQARRSIGRGWSERIEYTDLSAEAKGKKAFIGATTELVPAIRDEWSSLRGGS